MRSPQAFLIEGCCDFSIHLLLGIQFNDAIPYPISISVRHVALHLTLHPVLTRGAGLPDHPDPDETPPPLLVQCDFLDDQPDDLP